MTLGDCPCHLPPAAVCFQAAVSRECFFEGDHHTPQLILPILLDLILIYSIRPQLLLQALAPPQCSAQRTCQSHYMASTRAYLLNNLYCTDGSVDNGDEVRFVVELCRMKNLPGLYLLNIKRLRGGVWSFKFIYQTVLESVLSFVLYLRLMSDVAKLSPISRQRRQLVLLYSSLLPCSHSCIAKSNDPNLTRWTPPVASALDVLFDCYRRSTLFHLRLVNHP